MRSVVILGSTGSIGENALRVIEAHPEALRVAGLSTRTHITRVLDQALRFDVPVVAVADENAAREAETLARPHGIEVWPGEAGVAALAALPKADMVLCALVGLAGLEPVLEAIRVGHDIALATKEVLVAAGELVMRRRAAAGVRMLPVDSEHSALFQCLQTPGCPPACVRDAADTSRIEARVARFALTASGGPFGASKETDFDRVTPEEALAHPRWDMGRKVTIDSATMMNKGLEILEAHWLFNLPVAKIDVLIHPESVVHSMVTFTDGATLAQLSMPDMRFPIQYALTWPERLTADLPRLDLARMGCLTFAEPDTTRFPCLRLAREAAQAGGTAPAVLNAADEVAVEAFLAGAIPFSGIARAVEAVMAQHDVKTCVELETILEADAWARRQAGAQVKKSGTT
jgi:1-deoxy-D-xylulose-5-phosphate reductoisomerase